MRADPEGLWDLDAQRVELAESWVQWAEQQAFRPQLFITPTFDEGRLGYVSPERAQSAWRWLVRHVSEGMYGRTFRSWCKHAPFSYLVGTDYSRLGAVHLHAVVHGYLDFNLAHMLWKRSFGSTRADVHYSGLHIETIHNNSAEEERVALAHVVKYASKGSDLMSWWFLKSDPDLARARLRKSTQRDADGLPGPKCGSGGACQADFHQLELSFARHEGELVASSDLRGLTGSGPR
jgi:hypothetical protein